MKNVIYLFLMSVMMWLSGCSTQQEQSQRPNIAQSSNKYHMEVKMNPTPAQPLKENDMYIRLTDTQDQVVIDAEVIVSLSMKNMNHGDLSINATPTSEGNYVVKIVPVMDGEWIANVSAKFQEDVVHTQYVFEVKR